ncbi:hypothetical protein FZEAL_136 [Fusarium zealandicum]|uniref:Uncharacterized protein n=1 Tax=Fusarium zealandicum TaxID=1053134 RepID=A0A8H4XQK0_9HYPO|nr:hypothetical protein FZEAL_136 [Fusarium zealandicum]
MSKASAADASLGAPPAHEDGFAYAHGVFFAEASGQNRHRRATQDELKTHFQSGSDKDHPAHWFEAQLIHYGLPPSKTKSVARMRLFDAVNAGNLKVPANVNKLEGKLKKEWTKNDREAKKASKAAETRKPASSATKRKADDDVPAAKKAKTAPKTTTPKPKAVPKSTPTTAPKSAPKAATPKTATAKATSTKATASKAGPAATTASAPQPKKQTARRGGISQGPSRSTAVAPVSPEPRAPRTKQTARRSGAIMARGRIPAPAQAVDYDYRAPPPYSEFSNDPFPSDGYSSYGGYQSESSHGNDFDDQVTLAPLGLINGSYEIDCHDVTSEWSYDPEDFDLTLTIAGNALWGSFNLGIYEGVLYFDERPRRSSHDEIRFRWRGREDQGPIFYGNQNEGWIKFLGDGRIEGCLDMQRLHFQGRRHPGQGTRSAIDARSLQDEWNGYSEEVYEEENRSRWR